MLPLPGTKWVKVWTNTRTGGSGFEGVDVELSFLLAIVVMIEKGRSFVLKWAVSVNERETMMRKKLKIYSNPVKSQTRKGRVTSSRIAKFWSCGGNPEQDILIGCVILATKMLRTSRYLELILVSA
jgi:hypothetical protein